MGSHNSTSTRLKWLKSGSLERSWQDLVPFEDLEFHKQLFSKWRPKWWKIVCLLVITQPFMNGFCSNLNFMCKISCLKIIIKNVQNGGQNGRQELSLAIN